MIVASIYPAGGRGLHRGRSQFGSKPVPVNTQPTSQAILSEIEKEKSTQVNKSQFSPFLATLSLSKKNKNLRNLFQVF